jgi:hypothetical protein
VRALCSIALLSALLSSSCRQVAGYEAAQPDRGLQHDAAAADQRGPTGDSALDVSTPDGASNDRRIDPPMDGPQPADAPPWPLDGLTPDPDLEGPKTDLYTPKDAQPPKNDGLYATDAAITPMACAPGVLPLYTYTTTGKMTICEGSITVKQCDAHKLCAVNHHLCRPSDFVTHGGLTEKPMMNVQTTWAWLASCLGTNPSDTAGPTESKCSTCKAISYPGSNTAFAYDCGGVAAHRRPRRTGQWG